MNWTALERKFIFQTYRRQPLVLVRGKGSLALDANGKKYLDFFSGLAVNNLGHCHPKIVQAIVSQAKKLIHASNLYYTTPQIELAKILIERTFPGKVFFSNSGAEANECAVKLSRRWGVKNGGRYEIIAFEKSFHGRTLTTLTLTGQERYRKDFHPLVEKVVYARFNDLESVERMVHSKTVAVFVEVVQGEGGIVPADAGFLSGLRKLCDQHNLLLIYDEVQCGIGRTGKLFAFQHFPVQPDIVTAAKGLGGGLPIGATIAKNAVADLFGYGDHASTFGGNPVCSAAAVAVLKTMDKRFLGAAAEKGKRLTEELLKLQREFPALVREMRGLGLMTGMELKVPGEPFVDFCREHGLLIQCTQGNVLRFMPPLTIMLSEIQEAASVVRKAFQKQNAAGGTRQ